MTGKEKENDTDSGILCKDLYSHIPVDGRASRDWAGGREAAVGIDTNPRNFHSADVSSGIYVQGVRVGTWWFWTRGKTDEGRSGIDDGDRMALGCTCIGGTVKHM
ncbi:hypothetical protein Pcinc_008066 [Petrolisthes cinctipes]|uniref:Uncharacterized protein n=1 Tax=Petrolisthes cinctipes TaxID=88211 RepID=A0AAE1G9R3_PETCI|nr:hypothetical protein Pcinc_008066 [Petrolisthes cinctipes]